MTYKNQQQLVSYVDFLLEYNKKINLIGSSTTNNVWDRHIKDCLQIEKLIQNKNVKLADLGSGAGLPGLLLSIDSIREVHLFEKSPQKCIFLKQASKFSNNKIVIRNENLHDVKDNTFDIITSRALGNLTLLLDLSNNLRKKNTLLIFLKGKKIYDEINETKKKYIFNYKLYDSITSDEGKIIVIDSFNKI
jgi:16S rRNA (guanine527-N7)-methyltransferase